ncbi:(2Fe-2S)-binding protein [Histidinibacterium lentulum]|uniref:(2Fe-2S)-binding protein n=1 Tax=Histidinibacterium lentulum TaxID=2480588 RepID=A0A3N2R8P6_9RHOB|nr:(2Fe-2S)-binding protein [Histidinibacterium lentulum]ROU03797.1 (2Fe-2S)-binding protein [Histidinibacterium lentulum]
MNGTRSITLTVNGKTVTAEAPVRMHLGDFLRSELGLTGTHLGCEHGVCGACTLVVNGEAVRSCLMLAVQADGATVETVEGLSPPEGPMHPLQDAFAEAHGLQCGYCTPGMLMSLKAYLAEHPDADETELREALSGNICRCTGYQPILAAAMAAARKMRQGETV